MKNFRLGNFWSQNQGLTLVEILIVIAIISIISSFFIININQSSLQDEITEETDLLVADLRYVRNLAVSRTVYDFEDGADPQYPPGGYGIYFRDLPNQAAEYIIFADSGEPGYSPGSDKIIKQRTITNEAIELNDSVQDDKNNFYFIFITENQAVTDMTQRSGGKYLLEIINRGSGYPDKGYRSIVTMGERSVNSQEEFEYTWANFGFYYSEYVPPTPPSPPRDPGELIDLP